MSAYERNAQLALIRSGVDPLAYNEPEHFCFTGNAVGVSALGVDASCDWLEDYAEIVRFRVDMAIRHYSLPGVEKVKRELAAKEWGLLRLAGLRDELRGRLGALLARYPVVETDPFELSR